MRQLIQPGTPRQRRTDGLLSPGQASSAADALPLAHAATGLAFAATRAVRGGGKAAIDLWLLTPTQGHVRLRLPPQSPPPAPVPPSSSVQILIAATGSLPPRKTCAGNGGSAHRDARHDSPRDSPRRSARPALRAWPCKHSPRGCRRTLRLADDGSHRGLDQTEGASEQPKLFDGKTKQHAGQRSSANCDAGAGGPAWVGRVWGTSLTEAWAVAGGRGLAYTWHDL